MTEMNAATTQTATSSSAYSAGQPSLPAQQDSEQGGTTQGPVDPDPGLARAEQWCQLLAPPLSASEICKDIRDPDEDQQEQHQRGAVGRAGVEVGDGDPGTNQHRKIPTAAISGSSPVLRSMARKRNR